MILCIFRCFFFLLFRFCVVVGPSSVVRIFEFGFLLKKKAKFSMSVRYSWIEPIYQHVWSKYLQFQSKFWKYILEHIKTMYSITLKSQFVNEFICFICDVFFFIIKFKYIFFVTVNFFQFHLTLHSFNRGMNYWDWIHFMCFALFGAFFIKLNK